MYVGYILEDSFCDFNDVPVGRIITDCSKLESAAMIISSQLVRQRTADIIRIIFFIVRQDLGLVKG